MKLSDRIYRWRKATGKSTADAAKKVGVFAAAITQWESGATTPTTENLELFVRAIGMTMDRFYGETPPPAKRPAKRKAA